MYLGRIGARSGRRRRQGDRDPPEGARRAPRSQTGALEVHDPASRPRLREAGARRALRDPSRRNGAPSRSRPACCTSASSDALDGTSFYGISIENGRVKPAQRQAIRAAVETLGLGVRMTAHQDVLLTSVRDRAALLAILDEHGLGRPESVSRVRSLGIACPALPTCGLAMTHAENVLPHYFDAIEAAGLGDVDLEVRMTGCPEQLRAPAERRDRHLRLRQERPRDPGGRLASRHAARVGALPAHLGGADGAGAGRPLPRREGALPGRHAPRRLDRRHRLRPAPRLDRPRRRLATALPWGRSCLVALLPSGTSPEATTSPRRGGPAKVGSRAIPRNPFEPPLERCSALGSRRRVDRAGRRRRRSPRARARRTTRPPAARRSAAPRRRDRSRARGQAALARRRRHRRAQRLHPAHQPVPRPLHLLHLRQATRRGGREVVHARGGRRGVAQRRARPLHRGALLPRRQAGAGLRELSRMARRAGLPEHGEVPGRGVSHGGGGGDAPAHQRRAAHAGADGGAAALERVDGADARDRERATLREGRGAPRRARQEAVAAAAACTAKPAS